MTEIVFEQDKPVGHLVDGKFVPLSPVPTGDAFDELLDDAILGIERHPNVKFHLNAAWYARELIRKCITVGTLRDTPSWRDAINKIVAKIERDIRLEKRPELWRDG